MLERELTECTKAEKTATNFTNRLFNYSFITIGNVSPIHINSAYIAYKIIDTNSFAYITTNQYSFDKFYGIMIDTSASKHFRAGYGQFMIYIKNIKYTTIDISKVGIIYVRFGINLILSIGSVLI